MFDTHPPLRNADNVEPYSFVVFFWKIDTHSPPHKADNVEPYSFVMHFSGKLTPSYALVMVITLNRTAS